MSAKLREVINLLLEDENPKLSKKDPDESFLSAIKSMPNTGYFVADLDKVTTSSGTIPKQVKDAYALFKTVLNEYILENGTERVSPTAEFELSMVKPDPSIFSKLPKAFDLSRLDLTDRDKFDAALQKYKKMFTTTATPKSKVLYDDLVSKYYFEEQAALSVCFDTAKKLAQTKFCAAWSMKGDPEMFETLATKMDSVADAAAFCRSNGQEAIVVFNGQETADRDTLVHEVGHAQGMLRLATVKAYQKASESAGYFNKSAYRTASRADIAKQRIEKTFGPDTGGVPQYQIDSAADPDMNITLDYDSEKAKRAAGVLGGDYAISVMGDLSVSKEALMTRAKNFIKVVPQDFMDEKLDDNVETLLELGNYVFYRVTRKSFNNLTLLKGDENYAFWKGRKYFYLPLPWLSSQIDESTNAFRQISSANKLLMKDPAYKALEDVRAELWKRQLNVASEDRHVYALLALMPPRTAQSLLDLQFVAAADTPATDGKSALGEAYQLASFARSYLIDRNQENNMRITANQLRRIIREELDRMNEKNEDMKPGVKSVLDKYESEGDKLAGPSTPEKEKKRQQLMKDTAAGLKKAGVTGEEDIGMQLNLYYESIGRGVSDSTHSLAIELDKLQKQMQEAARRLLRRI